MAPQPGEHGKKSCLVKTADSSKACPMKQTIRLNLTPTEANILLHSLNELRNKWLEEGRDTCLVDGELFCQKVFFRAGRGTLRQ